MSLEEYFRLDGLEMQPLEMIDVLETVTLINVTYEYQNAAIGKPRTSAPQLTETARHVSFYVVKSQKRIVATVYIKAEGKALHFGSMAIAFDFRGGHLAAAIMKSVEAEARARNLLYISLEYLLAASWLKRYYERFGFRETGEIRRINTNNTLVRMVKRL